MTKRINVLTLAEMTIPALGRFTDDDFNASSPKRRNLQAATARAIAPAIGEYDIKAALALSAKVWKHPHDVGGPTKVGRALEAIVSTLEAFVFQAPIANADDVMPKLKLAEDLAQGRDGGLVAQTTMAMRKLIRGGASAPDLCGRSMTFGAWAHGGRSR